MRFAIFVVCAALAGCAAPRYDRPQSYDPPGSTITTSKPIHAQHRRTIGIGATGIRVSNEYAGARLSDFYALNDTLVEALILPENAPLNNSAWYGFKAWASEPQSVWVRLAYRDGTHRYVPKLSRDGKSWTPVESDAYRPDSVAAFVRLDVSPDTLWVSAQERMTSTEFAAWIEGQARVEGVRVREIGQSARGRPLQLLDFGPADATEHVLVISRQHPPEMTGTLALLPFIERLLADDDLARSFRDRFRVQAVPLVNPDGVDEGHWRHNTGGVDLNRDWLSFNQPETRQVRDAFLELKADPRNRVLFAIDFHSTQEDVFYTVSRSYASNPPGLIDLWLGDIAAALPDYHVNDEPSPPDSPVSKAWFYLTFGGTSLTYEVGDEQDRGRIREVAEAGAESMMRRLLEQPR